MTVCMYPVQYENGFWTERNQAYGRKRNNNSVCLGQSKVQNEIRYGNAAARWLNSLHSVLFLRR